MGAYDVLVTDRMHLRLVTAADVDDLVALDSDPEVMRHISAGAATPRAMLRDEILPQWVAIAATHPGCGFWAAGERSPDDAFLGWFHLKPNGVDPGDLDLGYRLVRGAWGRGYATEGARFLVRHAFATLGARRLTAHALQANTASCRVLEKAGFQFVRTYVEDRFPGGAKAAQYGLSRSAWRAGAP